MFIIDCKHPGCKNFANFQVPMKDWDCGMHELPKKKDGYLPSRHPAKKQFSKILRAASLGMAFFLLPFFTLGQDWQACHWYGYPVPVAAASDGLVRLPIPDNAHSSIVLASFLTTTNTPRLLGDLRGATISATFRLDATNNPILYYNNDTGYPGRYANTRLFFTTDNQPYRNDRANATETQYWWTYEVAWTNLNTGNFTAAIPGVYTLTASVDSLQWSSALGHFALDPNYTPAFLSAAGRVAQIGFSFGGGSYADVGVGVDNVNGDHSSAAAITVLRYSVTKPVTITVEESEDLKTWVDAVAFVRNEAPLNGSYRLKNSAIRSPGSTSVTLGIEEFSDERGWKDAALVILSNPAPQGFYRLRISR